MKKYTIDIRATLQSHLVIANSEDEASEFAYQEFTEYIKNNDDDVEYSYEVVAVEED